MRYVTLKKSKVLNALALAALVSSCSLKSNGQSQTLTIALPGAHFVQNRWMEKLTDWMSLAWASTTTASNLTVDPASLSEFDCFGVNVSGPGIDPDPNVSCTDTVDAPSIIGGFVPNGNASIDLPVPAGPNRSIKIFGVKSLIGCPNLHDMLHDGAINFSNIGHFYDIGGTHQDIFADALVTIKVTYNSASPIRAFNQCKRNGDGGDGAHIWGVYAGTGPGTINSTKTIGGVTYAGGLFDYVGPNTHSGAMLSQPTGAIAGTNLAHINGTVKCAAPDGAGGFFVGGTFTHVESTDFTTASPYQANVLHILADGSWDPSLVIRANAASSVSACLRNGTHLYLGGNFATLARDGASPASTNALADFDLGAQTFTDLGTALGAGAAIYALTTGSAHLYAGGYFTGTGSLSGHSNAAAFNIVSAPTLDTSWHPDPNSYVYSLYHDGNGLVYLGGAFTQINATASANIGRVAALTGALDSWHPTLSGATNVTSIVSDGTYVYAGVLGSTTQNVYRIDPTTASPSSIFYSNQATDSIDALALATATGMSSLYIGGKFTTTGAGARQNLIALDNPSGTYTLNTNFNGNTDLGSHVYAIAPDAIGRVYVGGTFNSIGGVLRKNLAAFSLLNGLPTPWQPLATNIGEVTSVISDGGANIYAGYKADASHTISAGVLKVTAGDVASSVWQKTATSYADGDVLALALSSDGTSVYTGGSFVSMDSHSSLTGIARLNSSTGAYDTSWTPTLGTASAKALLVTPNRVYVAGGFSTANSLSHYGLVAFNTADSNIVTGWANNSALVSGVQSLAIHPSGNLLVGTVSGTAAIKRISSVDGSTVTWANGPTGSQMSGMSTTQSMLISGGTLYIGGVATGGSGTAIVSYDLSAEIMNTSFNPMLYYTSAPATTSVNSIEVPATGILVLGGKFNQANVINSSGQGGKESLGIGLFDSATGVLF